MKIEKLDSTTHTLKELQPQVGQIVEYSDMYHPFGPFRRIVSLEPEGGYAVSAIIFSKKTRRFVEITGLHAQPLTRNVIGIAEEHFAKETLLKRSSIFRDLTIPQIMSIMLKEIATQPVK